ncbi:hypothetical protein SAMN05444172_2598 [Burkholderia sp. GAS332]|nr:hypothetical protein SAMN05444172_2598 [Burkholderia sp. GAS332]
MTDIVKRFVDVGGAAIRARHAALKLSAPIAPAAPAAEIQTLRAQLARAVEERDVLIAQFDVVVGA